MQLLLNTNGLQISLRNNSFRVRTKTMERLISPHRVTTILITVPVQLHSSAIQLAFEHDIPIYFFSTFGEVAGVFRKAGFSNTALIRRNQVLLGESKQARDWIIQLVFHKLNNQLGNCRYFLNRKPSQELILTDTIRQLESRLVQLNSVYAPNVDEMKSAIHGIEGAASKSYWQGVASVLDPPFRFEGRSRQPAQDYFNAALNYLYGIQYSMVETALFRCGLDPALGIFHADQYQKPVLAFDFIEPFRAWTDRFLVEKIWGGEIHPTMFDEKEDGFTLNKQGKQYIIPEYLVFMNERTTFLEHIRTRESHIQAYSADFARFLTEHTF